jgi:hypothetical protein
MESKVARLVKKACKGAIKGAVFGGVGGSFFSRAVLFSGILPGVGAPARLVLAVVGGACGAFVVMTDEVEVTEVANWLRKWAASGQDQGNTQRAMSPREIVVYLRRAG